MKTRYKASELNNVNETRSVTDLTFSRMIEVPSTVIRRNPQQKSTTQKHRLPNEHTTNETKTFNIWRTEGDGNCLFRSVSLHLYNTQDKHMETREAAVQYIRIHWNELKNFILTRTEALNHRSYCYTMRQNGTYGTSVEILAMSEVFKLNFNIYNVEKKPRNKKLVTTTTPTTISRSKHAEDINLILIGRPEDGHFELLKTKDNYKEDICNEPKPVFTRKTNKNPKPTREPDTNAAYVTVATDNPDKSYQNYRMQKRYSQPLGTTVVRLSENSPWELIPNTHIINMETNKSLNRNNQGGGKTMSTRRSCHNVSSPSENPDTASGISQRVRHTRNMDPQPPTNSALSNQRTTTKAGRPRQRITWTNQMNMDVMRCYYKATRLETLAGGFRPEIYQLFITIYPELTTKVTEQRLMDQKRMLVVKQKIPPDVLAVIKTKVAQELTIDPREEQNKSDTETSNNTMQLQEENLTPIQQIIEIEAKESSEEHLSYHNNIENTQNISNEKEATDDIINETLKTELTNWEGSQPNTRPPIPKLKFNKTTNKIIANVNLLLPKHLKNITDIEKLQTITYCAARTILTLNDQKPEFTTKAPKPHQQPAWDRRLQNQINKTRTEIGRLTQYINGKRTKHLIQTLENLLKKNTDPIITLDFLKQRLAVYAARLKRYRRSYQRKKQNTMFQQSEKRFYQSLTNDRSQTEQFEPPEKQEITTFWKNLWENPKSHNEHAQWIKREETKNETITAEEGNIMITTEQVQLIINKTHNWKTPGPDKLHNFWYKKLTNIHPPLAKLITEALRDPSTFPTFLTEGITYIKPKNTDTKNPANYRPICCLSTLYKIISATIGNKIEEHLNIHQILNEEQKGCKKNSRGYKEQLTIDTVIMKQAKTSQRNLSTCYIDYKKAYDSTPHSWLIKTLEIYKINPKIIDFLRTIMSTWRTRIILRNQTTNIETDTIQIKRGIFQGDTLSGLWFCIALNPLSNILNETNMGFKIKHQKQALHTVNHLMYMDDIKLYSESSNQLENLIRVTENFSNDIAMEFGVNKCKIQTIEKGKWKRGDPYTTSTEELIECMENGETYKYLGYDQHTQLDVKHIKDKLIKTFEKRLKLILNSNLNSRNTTKAVNTYAAPILTYSFGVIKWNNTELEQLNRMIRTKMTHHRSHHPHACIQRMTIERRKGGRGFIDFLDQHNRQIKSLREYFHNKSSNLHQSVRKADRKYTPLNLSQPSTHLLTSTEIEKDKISTWKAKELHARHINEVNKEPISLELSYKWLQQGEIYPETEGFILAAQDQVLPTNNYKKYITKELTGNNDRCRKCHLQSETISHITNGCKILVGTKYTERHDNLAKIIHQELAQKHKLITEKTPYYQYKPKKVLENQKHTLYWDNELQTDKTILTNRPDIVLIDKEKKQTYLIEISVPSDHNVKNKYTEKMEKYRELTTEIKRIWKQQSVTIIPFIISATGLTPTSFKINLDKLDLPHNLHTKSQKAVVINTASILREFLNS